MTADTRPQTFHATCLAGWHPAVFTSSPYPADLWEDWANANRRGYGFPVKLDLDCVKCGRVTSHAPTRVRPDRIDRAVGELFDGT